MTRQTRPLIALLLGLALLLGACGGEGPAPAGSNAWDSATWDSALWQ
ncbi:hypothetical protein HNQ04_003829 [Deinococcus radiopugnans ATCC 19172]|uniref:ABC transporter substrate-binding protein n=1 Tax=Deinococcus radiopugnans ATCC 19172 TaxID=585398 RepID=A0ABR6NXG5_9DEIO|nr:hypothetical protein [Deinococcus radiopugnans ATCC 19172]